MPFSQIFNNFEDNLFTENPSSFAEYIDFDFGDMLNPKEKKASASMRKLKLISEEANIPENYSSEQVDLNLFDDSDSNYNLNIKKEQDTDLLNDVFLIQDNNNNNNFLLSNDLVEVDLEYLNKLVHDYHFKNPYLKLDNEINWKIEQPNPKTNKSSSFVKTQNSQSQTLAKMCEEAVIINL